MKTQPSPYKVASEDDKVLLEPFPEPREDEAGRGGAPLRRSGRGAEIGPLGSVKMSYSRTTCESV